MEASPSQSQTDLVCLSWTELIQEAEAREWDDTLDNIWLRLAACDKYTGMETSFHNIEDRNLQGLGWAAATRPVRLLRKQLESVLGKKARQHRRVLDIPDDTWDLLWDGERALKVTNGVLTSGSVFFNIRTNRCVFQH